MASEIQTLPDNIIDLIAAGEVIDSLAAVIRELVENSLDAQATRIAIALNPESWRVRVSDNGKGMSLNDLRICAQPHSTSKIRTEKDLWRITSLGFRGEALHSITQVADLSICSRARESTSGWQVAYDEAQTVEESIMAMACGTIVSVSNLFAKIPVRRRALPSTSQQLKAIQKLIQHISLCHPEVTWQLRHKDNHWFSISPGTTAKDILPQFLRNVGHSDLHELKVELATPAIKQLIAAWGDRNITPVLNAKVSPSQIDLVMGLPDRCHRHRGDWIKVAVNNRFVRSPELEQTIVSAMAKTLPRDRYPVCIVHLHTCPSQVDWNRHPAKSEIYLHSMTYWQAEFTKAIEQALRFNTANLPDAVGDRRIGKMLKVAEASSKKYHIDKELAKRENSTSTAKINSLELTAIAQASKTYIVAEHASGSLASRTTYCPRARLVRTATGLLGTSTAQSLNHLRISQTQTARTATKIRDRYRTIWRKYLGGTQRTQNTGRKRRL